MKSLRTAILLVIPVLMIPWDASAQTSIYSWTDENGVKHFSDKAPVNVEANRQEITEPQVVTSTDAENPANGEPSTANDTAEVTTEPTDAEGASAELSYADQQRQQIAERREAERKKKAERDLLCLQARDRLARVEPNRRVFSTDEDGNTVRLDDEERVRLVEENKNQIAEYCD